MTAPPLPASPCLKVRLDYNDAAGNEMGSRFFLSYAGASPTPGNCQTIAADIAAAWSTHLAPQVSNDFALVEVDVLDIASLTGASGQWTGQENGGDSSGIMPASVAVNIEFNISRRYRGGKPRMFLPTPGTDALQNQRAWTAAYVTNCGTAVSAFFAAVAAISVGAVGVLAHVNLSYYTGFKNITNSSGRERAVPQYRPAALLDPVEGYAVKGTVGSQRRRRTSTTY